MFLADTINSNTTTTTSQEEALQLLPPWHQEAKEKESIQKDSRLAEYLGTQVVREIQKTSSGYLVITDSSKMRVDVVYLPREDGMCGPARFELVFFKPEPLTN
jgi:hypothetical protein